MINTKRVTDRRALRFGRMEDIERDIEALNQRVEAGATLRASGNLTPAQIVDHLMKMASLSLDGFPPNAKASLFVRGIVKMMKRSVLIRPLNPGIRLPRKLALIFGPEQDVSWAEAIAHSRAVMARLKKGERMTARSPALGALAHEEWIQLHCRHAEMHLSFIHPS